MAAKKTVRPKKGILKHTVARFEELLKSAEAIQHYQLRLYVTGTTMRSTQAISNIRALCEEYLTGHYDLEVIDIYQQPAQATHQQIIAAPTLVKERPVPPRRLVGDLSNRDKVLVSLNINKKPATVRWLKI